MGYGKIWVLPTGLWTGLSFPDDAGAPRYMDAPDHANLDFGTGDFAIEALVYMDNTIANQANYKLLLSKGPWNLAALAGFNIAIQPDIGRIYITFNDGTATAVGGTWDGVFTLNTYQLFRFEFDRDVGVTLYKNGAKNATVWTGITGRTGSISNADPLRAGGIQGSGTTYWKGYYMMLAVDCGHSSLYNSSLAYYQYLQSVNYGDVWNYERYLRLAHNWPRKLNHYRMLWNFQNSLEDEGPTGLDFVFKDNAGATQTPTYGGSMWPPSSGISFPYDPLSGVEEGPLPLDTAQRTLDGTLRIYRAPTEKRYKKFRFRTDNVEQVIALLGAYYSKAPVHYWDQNSAASYQPWNWLGYFLIPPTVTEIYRMGDPTSLTAFKRLWEISCELEEL